MDKERKIYSDLIAAINKLPSPDKLNDKATAIMGAFIAMQCLAKHPDNHDDQVICAKFNAGMFTNPQAIFEKIKATFTAMETDPLLFDVQDIITTDKTEYKVSCKGTVHWSGGASWWKWEPNTQPFIYTVEKTDNGNLYVTEWGLRGLPGEQLETNLVDESTTPTLPPVNVEPISPLPIPSGPTPADIAAAQAREQAGVAAQARRPCPARAWCKFGDYMDPPH